jgi:hypothetical protein
LFSLISGGLPMMAHVTTLTSHPICALVCGGGPEFRSDAYLLAAHRIVVLAMP